MALKPSFLLTLGGILLAWLAWTLNPSPLYNVSIGYPSRPAADHAVTLPFADSSNDYSSRFTLQGTMDYLPVVQSGIVRIIPDDCIESLSVNGFDIEALKTLEPAARCYPEVVTLDLSPYLSPGRNQIKAAFRDFGQSYGVDVKSRRSLAALLLVTGGLGAALYGLGGLWRQSETRRIRLAAWLQRWWKHMLVIDMLLVVALYEKLLFFDFISGDFVGSLNPWLMHIQHYGLGAAYGENFSNYAPLYTYLLGITDFFLSLNRVHMVKLLSFVGEGVAGYFAYRIVALLRGRSSLLAVAAPFLLFAAPSAIANAAASQCDVWYTSFLLATACALLYGRPTRALVYYGIAFSLKQQAIFLSPFLLACLFKRIIPWKRIWIVPAAYLAAALPAWAEGRPLADLLLVYWAQFNTYASLGDAANIYFFMSDNHYELIRDIGLVFATLVACLFVELNCRRWHPEDGPATYLLLAALCVALMPFVLPKMLDRYFFPADMFSLVLACVRPQWVWMTLLFQCASILAYPGWNFPGITWRVVDPYHLQTALIMNSLAIAMLTWLCWQHVWKRHRTPVPLPVRVDKIP